MRYFITGLADLTSVVDNERMLRTPFRDDIKQCLESSFTIRIFSIDNGLVPSFKCNSVEEIKEQFPEEFI